jgi:hypothetical protein
VITFSMKSIISIGDYVKNVNNNKLPPVVKKHAFAVQADAAHNAPVDTGALKNSLHADPLNPRNWTVSDGVEYGVFQELGTSRGVRAKHFLGNACEKEADKFFDDVREALT